MFEVSQTDIYQLLLALVIAGTTDLGSGCTILLRPIVSSLIIAGVM